MRSLGASVPPDRNPLYPARFVLQWAVKETERLSEAVATAPPALELEGRLVPIAHGIIGNLRMALEHVAHEAARSACPDARPERVSFPVAVDGWAFRSMMDTRFPGLRVNHPALWGCFRDVQSYRPGNSRWLTSLHGLWNRTIPISVRRESPGGVPAGRAGAPPSEEIGAPTLCYGRGRPLLDLLVEAGIAERDVIGRVEGIVESLEPPTWVVDRRYRR